MEANNDGSFSFPREEEYINPLLNSEFIGIGCTMILKNGSKFFLTQPPITKEEALAELLKGRTPRLKM